MDVLPRKRMIAWDKSRNLGPVSTASSMQVANTVPNSADLRATPSAHYGRRVATTHDPLDECMVAFVSGYWPERCEREPCRSYAREVVPYHLHRKRPP